MSFHAAFDENVSKIIFTVFSEILRCLDSLQLVDKYKIIATPANWTVCESVVKKFK